MLANGWLCYQVSKEGGGNGVNVSTLMMEKDLNAEVEESEEVEKGQS